MIIDMFKLTEKEKREAAKAVAQFLSKEEIGAQLKDLYLNLGPDHIIELVQEEAEILERALSILDKSPRV